MLSRSQPQHALPILLVDGNENCVSSPEEGHHLAPSTHVDINVHAICASMLCRGVHATAVSATEIIMFPSCFQDETCAGSSLRRLAWFVRCLGGFAW